MPLTAKIAIFFAALFGTLWLIRKFPHHPVARVAQLWLGPFPLQGETLSRFLFRRALYSFKLSCQAIVGLLALWILASWYPTFGETPWFLVVGFALTLIGGTFLLATGLYAASSLKQRWFGPNPIFHELSEAPEA